MKTKWSWAGNGHMATSWVLRGELVAIEASQREEFRSDGLRLFVGRD
jgi:hypothetical protein